MNLGPFAPYLAVIHLVMSIVIITLVLLQAKGGNIGALMGGGDSSGAYRTKRGLELTMHRWTIYFSIIFFVLTVFTFIAMGQTTPAG